MSEKFQDKMCKQLLDGVADGTITLWYIPDYLIKYMERQLKERASDDV